MSTRDSYNNQSLIESYYQGHEAYLITLQEEINKNRGYRKLLVTIFFAGGITTLILFLLISTSLWISVSARDDIINARELADSKKQAVLEKLDYTITDIKAIKDHVDDIQKNQSFIDGKMKELDEIRIRLSDTEVDLQVITALLRSFRDGEVKMKAGTDKNGIRNFRADVQETPLP